MAEAVKEKPSSFAEVVENCCAQLRRRQIQGSLPCAKRTAEIMRALLTMQRHPDAASLIDDVRAVGYKLQAAKPVELAIGNIVRRVLHLIREEAQTEKSDSEADSNDLGLPGKADGKQDLMKSQEPGLLSRAFKSNRTLSLSNLLDLGIEDIEKRVVEENDAAAAALADAPGGVRVSGNGASVQAPRVTTLAGVAAAVADADRSKGKHQKKDNWKAKHKLIEDINELLEELDNITSSITSQGVEHLHANEVILTLGMSDTTYAFLREAARKREFQVVVAEGAPRYDGHLQARKLADAGIQVTAIPDSAVFAMMARANKVLVGAHAVLANGGAIAPAGIHMVALAAHKHSTPLVVLVGLHKLSPQFPHDPDLLYNDFRGPAEVADCDMLAQGLPQQMAYAAAHSGAGGGSSEEASNSGGEARAQVSVYVFVRMCVWCAGSCPLLFMRFR
uniref:Translation initiation factor eIF2B subunit beta n=1 Tax=Dunaliella tertiolecta TaxID=3047 RepID=A0A7S3R8N0_DUNTE